MGSSISRIITPMRVFVEIFRTTIPRITFGIDGYIGWSVLKGALCIVVFV
jgi:hypothetical protein